MDRPTSMFARTQILRAPEPEVHLKLRDGSAWFDLRYGDDFELTVFGRGREDAIARLEALRDACTRALEAAAQPAEPQP